jgi:hypothetical protein
LALQVCAPTSDLVGSGLRHHCHAAASIGTVGCNYVTPRVTLTGRIRATPPAAPLQALRLCARAVAHTAARTPAASNLKNPGNSN